MPFVPDNQITKLSLTEINQAQSFIRFKRRWPARLRSLLYLGIALVLFSGAGSAITNRDLHSYWGTSPTTSQEFEQDYSQDQLLYSNSDLIFGCGFFLGLIFMVSGLYFFRKFNTCCLIECKLREQEIRLMSSEYPRPDHTGRADLTQKHPLTQQQRDRQYPTPASLTTTPLNPAPALPD